MSFSSSLLIHSYVTRISFQGNHNNNNNNHVVSCVNESRITSSDYVSKVIKRITNSITNVPITSVGLLSKVNTKTNTNRDGANYVTHLPLTVYQFSSNLTWLSFQIDDAECRMSHLIILDGCAATETFNCWLVIKGNIMIPSYNYYRAREETY